MTTTVGSVAELEALVGKHLGYSEWREVTQQRINTFADATDDHQWIHVDAERAAAGPFGTTIAHGFLTASVISAAVANHLPGPGTIYLSQLLNFRAPVRIGETVHACVSVKSVDPIRRRVTLETTCTVGETVVIDGEALVMTTSSAKRPALVAAVQPHRNLAPIVI